MMKKCEKHQRVPAVLTKSIDIPQHSVKLLSREQNMVYSIELKMRLKMEIFCVWKKEKRKKKKICPPS